MAGRIRLVQVLPGANTTPGVLRILLIAIVGLATMLAIVGGLAQSQAASGTKAITDLSKPLVVDAVAIYGSIADANTVAAQAFLSGGLEPTAQAARYDEDIDEVGRRLIEAATRVEPSGPSAQAIRTISEQLPVYTGLIEAARANNRQGLPVGSAYLAEANQIARTIMLPAADQLLSHEQTALDEDYSAAHARGLQTLTFLLILALGAVLVVAQVFLSRKTQRTLNVGLVAASTCLLVVTLIVAVAAILQGIRLSEARDEGTDPLVRAAQARITALVQHSDDSLILVSRGASADFEQDFQAGVAELLGVDGKPGLLVDGSAADAAEQAYVDVHRQLMAELAEGDYNGAVALATSTSETGGAGAFATLDKAIVDELTTAEQRFDAAVGSTSALLSVVALIVPIACIVIAAGAALGIRRRLEEYR